METEIINRLDRIIELLEAQQTRRALNPTTVTPTEYDTVHAAISQIAHTLIGKFTAAGLAELAGIANTKSNAIAIGRVMDERGAKRARNGRERYFIVG